MALLYYYIVWPESFFNLWLAHQSENKLALFYTLLWSYSSLQFIHV